VDTQGTGNVTWAVGNRTLTWYQYSHAIFPYVKNAQIFKCPSDQTVFCSYGYNIHLGYWSYPPAIRTGPYYQGTSMGAVEYPAEHGMIAERRVTGLSECCDTGVGWFYLLGGINYSDSPQARNPHNEGANIGFVDGHAKWFRGGSYGDTVYPGASAPSGIRWYMPG
jgi:prepilin-type processing-associated H-X9-DG protein